MRRVLLLLALAGCASTQTVHGIPNFDQVEPGIYRGGQPSAEGWSYLASLGVTSVVKLNMPDEGSDDGARALGMAVHELGVQPADDRGFFWNAYDTTVEPDDARVREAVKLLAMGPGVYVHCQHGQDRTGLVVGAYRVEVEHWDKHAARKEMLVHGSRIVVLTGLEDYWSERVP